MQAILPWLLVSLILITAWPWAAWLLTRYPHDDGPWLSPLLTLALSTGMVTLVMFWEALVGIELTATGISLPYLALMLPGSWLWWRSGHPSLRPILTRPTSKFAWFAALILALVAAGILFNSIYWPFWRDDTLGIYARFGALMADNGALVELPSNLTLYEAYPILIPLTYSYAYLVSGWPNEFLARLFPALLSLGCLGTAYTLGNIMRGSLAGWISTLLLALSPTFGSWASSGYVDLPMAFFYSLSAIFAWRLSQKRHLVDALLAGIAMGLAAWTKNAALLGIVVLALWLLWLLIRRRIGWLPIVLALGACGAIAGPWYLRNLIQASLIIPDTAWTEQAARTIDTLLILVTRPEVYSLSGILIFFSILSTLPILVSRRFDVTELLLLLLWSAPFFAAWWLWVSYDPRFVLLFLPIMCAIAGIQLASLWEHTPERWQRITRPSVILVVLGLALAAIWNSVEFKDDILRNPIMTPQERRTIIFAELRPWKLPNDSNAP